MADIASERGNILRTPPHPTYGNSVRAYGADRTLCDMLRSTLSPDLQLL